MTVVVDNLSPQIQAGMQQLVQQGWFRDIPALLEEAVRRYLETHSAELMDRFVAEDIAWGLRGAE